MTLKNLPKNAFLHPDGSNREEIERLFEGVSELLLNFGSQATERSPFREGPSMRFQIETPKQGRSSEELLSELQKMLHASANMANPGYVAHMDSLPSAISVAADFSAGLLNNNMLSRELSPVFTELEDRLLAHIGSLLGLPSQSKGVMLSGGSLANLQALAVARNKYLGTFKYGLYETRRRPVIFASELAHTSIQKAAMLLGLGTNSVISIPVDKQGKLDCGQLQLAVERAEVQGDHPFAVVGMVGTTSTGNIDPLRAIGNIARDHHIWFHVDAAYGGALTFSEQHREKMDGIEMADSVTFNPQKWLYVTKSSAMVLFRDGNMLEKFFRISLPYMQDGGEAVNRGEISVQGTRHVDVLKLWLTLQHFGSEGCAELVNHSLELTQEYLKEIQSRPQLELATEPEINILLFRFASDEFSEVQLDEANRRLQEFLLQEKQIYLSLPLYRDRRWLRAVLLNPFTSEKERKTLFEGIDEFLKQPSNIL